MATVLAVSALLCGTGCKNAASDSSGGSSSGTSSGTSLTLAESVIAGKTFENGRTKLSFGNDKRGTKSSGSARAIADGDFTWTATFSGTDVNVTMTNSGGSSSAVLTGDTLSVDGTNYTLSGSGASSGGSSSGSGSDSSSGGSSSGSGSGSSTGGGTTPETNLVSITFKAAPLNGSYIGVISYVENGQTLNALSHTIRGKAGESIYNSSLTNISTHCENADCAFDKWDKDFPTVFPAADMTITASFKKKVTVTLQFGDRGSYASGSGRNTTYSPTRTLKGFPGEPLDPLGRGRIHSKDGYTFVRWEPSLPAVYPASDTTYNAIFKGELDKTPTVGDIIMKDGSVKKASDSFTKADAIAVVYKVDSTTYTAYALGLKSAEKQWAARGTYANKTYEVSDLITNVRKTGSSPISGNGAASDDFSFDGYLDGSTGLAKLKSVVGTGYTETNFPAWYWAENYGNTNCAGTNFTAGWYFPSQAEVFDVWKADRVLTVSGSFRACSAESPSGKRVWSSSQRPNTSSSDTGSYGSYVEFNDTYAFVSAWPSTNSGYVYAVRKFKY